jgi:hypothetical protein
VHYNDGAGGLVPYQFVALCHVQGDWIPTADLDDDGLPDIVAECLFLNRGGRRPFLELPPPPGAGLDFGRVALADLDGDGRPEVVLGNRGAVGQAYVLSR